MQKIQGAHGALCAVVAAVCVAACGGGGGGGDEYALGAVISQPDSVTVLTGETATFTIATNDPGAAIQWYRDGEPIPGASGASYTTPPVTWRDDGAAWFAVVDGAGGTFTSEAAYVTLRASDDQAAFEAQAMAPGGAQRIHWRLNPRQVQVAGSSWSMSRSAVLTASPLTLGPQALGAGPVIDLTHTLGLPDPLPSYRVLAGGSIHVVFNLPSTRRVAFDGTAVVIETYAADGQLAFRERQSGFRTTELTGEVRATPDTGFRQQMSGYYDSPDMLRSGTDWLAGSTYTTYTSAALGDRYWVYDCGAATTGPDVSPCRTGTTLEAALTAGITSTSDRVTYTLADGTLTTVDGLPMWVAKTPRPTDAAGTGSDVYRVYFAMNGNVYTGALLRDGTVHLQDSYTTVAADGTRTVTWLPYHLQFNQAARESLYAATAR